MVNGAKRQRVRGGRTKQRREQLSKEQVESVLIRLNAAVDASKHLSGGDDDDLDDMELLDVMYPDIKLKRQHVRESLCGAIAKLSSLYGLSTGSTDASTNDDMDAAYNQASEVADECLDSFNRALDRARGIENASVAVTGGLAPIDAKKLVGRLSQHAPKVLDIDKPQVHFPDYPIDNSRGPFVPPYQQKGGEARRVERTQKQKKKNVTVDKDAQVDESSDQYLKNMYGAAKNRSDAKDSAGSTEQPSDDEAHPLEAEIDECVQQVSKLYEKDGYYTAPEYIPMYKSLDETPFTFVETEDQLRTAMEHICTAKELAIDLEAHSTRSFQGFICLMQVSTREQDFVIDTLKLRGSIHDHFDGILRDASVTKVLHGADYDVQWLQRDFGLYIVNLFDTGQASRILKLSSNALSFLLTKICNVQSTNKKQFQLADWRQRPLPDPLLQYARSDTHYLLYIYDHLRKLLDNKGLLCKHIWQRSAVVGKKMYKKCQYNSDMSKQLAAKHGLGFDAQQMKLLEKLCDWRDATARTLDESLNYIAPVHVLYGIVRAGKKVASVDGFMKHGFPTGVIPPVMREHVEQLVMLICDAYYTEDKREHDERLHDEEGSDKKNVVVEGDEKGNVQEDKKMYNVKENIINGEDADSSKQLSVDPGKLDAAELGTRHENADSEGSSSDDDDVDDDVNAGSNDKQKESSTKDPQPLALSEEDKESTPDVFSSALPAIKKRRSALLGSDSEESSDEEDYEAKPDMLTNLRQGEDTPRTDSRTEQISETQVKAEDELLENGDGIVSASASAVTGDEAEAEPKNHKQTVSEIIQSISMVPHSENDQKNAPDNFKTESDLINAFRNTQNDMAHQTKDEDVEVEVEQMQSIREMYGDHPKKTPSQEHANKRRRSAPSGDEDNDDDEVEPFNYKQASLEDEKQKKMSRKQGKRKSQAGEEGFDPMRKLKTDWKEDRPRVRKRRKGKGKSMSFHGDKRIL